MITNIGSTVCAVALIVTVGFLLSFPARGDGVVFEAAYTADYWSTLTGGIEQGDAYLDNLDVTIEVDAERLFGLPGVRFFAYGLYNNGREFSSTLAGDFQVASNIETGVRATRLYEAWVNVDLSDDTDVLFGIYDLNGEFDVLESAALYLQSGHGIGSEIGQTGDNGPSIFPITGLGLRLAHRFSDSLATRIAILDGVPGDPDRPDNTTVRLGGDDGALLVAELDWQRGDARVLVGGWGYTKKVDLETQPPSSAVRNAGVYLRAERVLSRRTGELTAFGRLGFASEDVNPSSHFIGAGLTWSAFSAARPDDLAGIAVAFAGASKALTDAQDEVAIELTYRWQITDRVALQPDIQYIINPGLDSTIDNALTAALRLELGLF